MIYSLFTEIDLANKKCAFRRISKVVWAVLTQTTLTYDLEWDFGVPP